MILFFDTETTGLPTDWNAPFTDVHNWPRIIQLAWQLCSDEGEVIREWSSLVKPDGWVVPEGEFWKEHGYSTEECEIKGVTMPKVLTAFCAAANASHTLVAHNLSYDLPVIKCEMFRYKIKPDKSLKHVCTKLLSEPICKIPGFKGKYKWPTLQEAYKHFFGKEFEGGHDALADVNACKEVYFEIMLQEEIC